MKEDWVEGRHNEREMIVLWIGIKNTGEKMNERTKRNEITKNNNGRKESMGKYTVRKLFLFSLSFKSST